MDTSTKFQVDKVEFEQERTKLFHSFLKDQSLTDVTLVNDEDLEINAHKIILSSISPVLRKIFERRPQEQPILFLRGVKSDHLRALVDYIYTGEASIDVNNLNEFIQVGTDLKIVGLTDDDDEEASNDHISATKIVLEESSISIEPVKAEPIIENETSTGIRKNLSGGLMELTNSQEKGPEVDQVLVASARARALTEGYFYNYDKKKNALMTQVSGQMWKCTKCKKEMKKYHLKEHVGIHMEGQFNYTCRFCNNTFTRCMKFQRHLTPCITEAILNKTLTHETVKLQAPPELNYQTVSVQEYELMVDKHLRRSGENPHFEWTCSQCDHKTTQKDMLMDHIENMHLDQICFPCESCRKTQTKYSVYRRHYKTCLKSSKSKVINY